MKEKSSYKVYYFYYYYIHGEKETYELAGIILQLYIYNHYRPIFYLLWCGDDDNTIGACAL